MKQVWKILFFLFAAAWFASVNAESGESAAVEHPVVRGESLWGIAKKYEVPVSALQKANESRYPSIATNPDRILEGWTLAIPARVGTSTQAAIDTAHKPRQNGGVIQTRVSSRLGAQPAKTPNATQEGFAWTKAAANRCRLSFEDALKTMGDSEELRALFRAKREAKEYQWVRLKQGEFYETMCFGKRIARNVTNALPNDMPEWAYWAREYTVEKDGVRYRRRDPLVCGNILKLPDEQISPPAPPKEPQQSQAGPPKRVPPEKTTPTKVVQPCECGELFEVVARIGPLPQKNRDDPAEIYIGGP